MEPGKSKFGPGFGKIPKYAKYTESKTNKKLAKLKSRKAKKRIASNNDQIKLISEIAAKKGIPNEIESIIVKKAQLPMNPKLKKDIKVAAQFRKVQNRYCGSKLMGESKWTFSKLDRKYRPGLVNALALVIKDDIHGSILMDRKQLGRAYKLYSTQNIYD